MSQETEWNDDAKPRGQETEFASPSPVDLQAAEAAVGQEWKEGDVILDLYEVKGVLGEGGFGKVYRVRHKGWNIDLAVKTPRIDRLDEAGKENFRNEAETWVNLGLHPHTVSCYYVRDLGGIPRVFAEYVEGGSLSDWIRTRKLYEGGKEEALKRMLDVAIQFAWGLHYAHEQGLVHQDVKPANVMMTPEGVAKVTDFGLARARFNMLEGIHQEMEVDKTFVVPGAGALTPAYASPEQTAGEPLTVKSDLWSWAASVLEMFAGGLFWQSGTDVEESLSSYLRDLPEEVDLPAMPEAVANLLRRCFESRKAERPSNMLEVASTLEEIYRQALDGNYPRRVPEPGKAIAGTLNNRAASLLDLGKDEEAKALWDEALNIQPAHLEATYNRGLLQWRKGEVSDLAFLNKLQKLEKTDKNTWRACFLISLVNLERTMIDVAIERLESIKELEAEEEVKAALSIAQGLLPQTTRHLRTLEDGKERRVRAICLSPDGKYAFAGGGDNLIKLWDTKTGELIRTFSGHDAGIASMAISVDGKHIFTGSHDQTLKLWEVSTGECLRTYTGHQNKIDSVGLSADGQLAVSSSVDGTIRIWDLQSGECLGFFNYSPLPHRKPTTYWSKVEFSKKDAMFAICGVYGSSSLQADRPMQDLAPLQVWDLSKSNDGRIFEVDWHSRQTQEWAVLERISSRPTLMTSVKAICPTNDGRHVLCACTDKTLQMFELATGKRTMLIFGHTPAESLSISEDDRYLALESSGLLQFWDLHNRECIFTLLAHAPSSQEQHKFNLCSVSLDKDARHVLTVGADNAVRFFQIGRREYDAPVALSQIVLSEEAAEATSNFERGLAEAREALSANDLVAAVVNIGKSRSQRGFERSEEAMYLYTQLYRRLPRKRLKEAWVTKTYDEVVDLRLNVEQVTDCQISLDGRYALNHNRKGLKCWELETGNTLWERDSDYSMLPFRMSGNGKYVALEEHIYKSKEQTAIMLLDLATGEKIGTLEGHTTPGQSYLNARALSISLNGKYLLSGGADGTVKLWEVSTALCLRTFTGHAGSVKGVALSNCGAYAISCSAYIPNERGYEETGAGVVKIWDVALGQCLHNFESGTTKVNAVAFSHDSTYAFARFFDDKHDPFIKMWDVGTGQLLKTFEGINWGGSLIITGDGKFLLSGIHLIEIESGEVVYKFDGNNCFMSADGSLAFTPSVSGPLEQWSLDWELEEREVTDWDEGARPYLNTFLVQFGGQSLEPSNFQLLLDTLGCSGYGWLRPDGIRRELAEMVNDWSEPLPLVQDQASAHESLRLRSARSVGKSARRPLGLGKILLIIFLVLFVGGFLMSRCEKKRSVLEGRNGDEGRSKISKSHAVLSAQP